MVQIKFVKSEKIKAILVNTPKLRSWIKFSMCSFSVLAYDILYLPVAAIFFDFQFASAALFYECLINV